MAESKIYDSIIVGAGISGIGTAIKLREAGFENLIILEKADDIGGTWRDNTYPGCECDVPSVLYSFSFEQKPDWSRTFAGQAEIQEYVQETTDKYGIRPYIRFNQAVERAQWQDDEGLWKIETADQTYYARTVVSCSGYLHEPIIPDIPGLKEFKGKLFHSSRWDHDHDLTGERVAVIGTGASAIQFVPIIQPQVKHLSIFQRTAQWVLPKPNRRIPELEKTMFKASMILSSWRQTVYAAFESFGIGFRRPALLKQFQKVGLKHLDKKVPDPELRRKLTPDYILGCKRVLMSNRYYPAVSQNNVDLYATGVKEVRGNVVVGGDGSEAEVDTIILGTGFYVTEQPIAQRIFDAEGRSLSELWKEGMQAYRGTTIAGLPNAFMVLGPNLGIGHNSAFIVIEAQINYIVSALKTMRKQGLSRIEIPAEVQEKYNVKIQRDLQGTVWNAGGCSSYYLDKNGFNGIAFPWSTLKMRSLLSKFDVENYETVARPEVVLGKAA